MAEICRSEDKCQQKLSLEDYCDEATEFYMGKTFNPSDKDRFYVVTDHSRLTVVALSELTLIGGRERKTFFISRTMRDKVHAELQFIEQATEVIQQARQEINFTEVSLVTMSTKSPCSNCREKLTKFLTQWEDKLKPKVKFTLRLSELYHESSETSGRAQMKLLAWKNELQELGVDFTLELVSVTTELSQHEIRKAVCKECEKNGKRKECEKCLKLTDKQRKDCFARREKDDKRITEYINSINTQQDITKYLSTTDHKQN